MQKQLLTEETIQSDRPVERSVKLNSFFSDKEFMLVRPLGGERFATLEIRSAAIEAVNWCNSN